MNIKAHLDAFYAEADPWQYDTTPDDQTRKDRLLSLLPRRDFKRVLDIGCGNGFLTVDLPGEEVVGLDISERAIDWARARAALRPDANRFQFHARSLFETSADDLGDFDLIVIAGVLYPQYIANGFVAVQLIVDNLLRPAGVLASLHIEECSPHRFGYTLLDASYYDYREYSHRLEVYLK